MTLRLAVGVNPVFSGFSAPPLLSLMIARGESVIHQNCHSECLTTHVEEERTLGWLQMTECQIDWQRAYKTKYDSDSEIFY